jgi:predicted metal-dependent phosphotriesterase family hydrolase
MRSKFIQTVLDDIPSQEIKTTQMHEHIIIENYSTRWGYESVLDDKQVAIDELKAYRELGGSTIVELTPIDSGRDPITLREISQSSGVHIVMGTSITLLSKNSIMQSSDVSDLAAWMVRELTEGVEDTGIRAGIIGELGVGSPSPEFDKLSLSTQEVKLLRAAAKAYHATGALISLDTHHGKLAMQKLAILMEEQIPPERVIVGHLGDHRKLDDYLSIAKLGANLGFDHIGMTNYAPDEWRIEMLKRLIDLGFVKQIVLSMDVHLRSTWKSMGGCGYDYLLREFVPMMHDHGISEHDCDIMLVENPRRLLPFEN